MEARSAARRLFGLGFLTLYLELALIRFLPGNIWNLGYFPNLVLLAVFIGMGSGFVFHHLISEAKSRKIFDYFPICLFAFIVAIYVFQPVLPGFSRWSGNFGNELFFTATSERRSATATSYFSFAFWFLSIVLIFAMISQFTAKFFATFKPLRAYTLDIGGSCFGILAFIAISWFHAPAAIWFAALIPLFLFTTSNPLSKLSRLAVVSLAAISILIWQKDSGTIGKKNSPPENVWSPYQKVSFIKNPDAIGDIAVNGISHQEIVSPEKLKDSFYQVVYNHRTQQNEPLYRNVLVIGAGSGNDVATALQNQVEHVDAVEIDPVIAEFGRKYHPAQGYKDPRVTVHIDDGRSFMTETKQKYDLIIFALTDSLVKVSPMAQLRLENYLFTEQSIRRAFSLLSERGSLVLYNFYREQWLLDKITAMVEVGTGVSPQSIFRSGDFSILLADRFGSPAPTTKVDALTISTDDWPFLYLKEKGFPQIYRFAMLIMILLVGSLMVFVAQSKRLAPVDSGASSTALKIGFVVMGMAFLLLETKSIIQFSLLFGTTWLNNSLVFLAVLVFVLAANYMAEWIRSRALVGIAYLLLIASCLVTLVYPLANLLQIEDRTLRFILASLATFSPIFFANVIFSAMFRNQKVAEHLFGWNLIGATIGGVLEYSSMALGYNSLTVIVAVCYTVVFGLFAWSTRSTSSQERTRDIGLVDVAKVASAEIG